MGGPSKIAIAAARKRPAPKAADDDNMPEGLDPEAWKTWPPWLRELMRKAAKLKGAF